jgi:hypothetical protein
VKIEDCSGKNKMEYMEDKLNMLETNNKDKNIIH